ncbi:PLC-like phosphodiesterase [Eremomyces bilateralis CBS 781.70]|uniref:PLC-like phosphodiesterase n=1 Tax=Eremomyces bilateralis CBS 781.70 TaxID=1392243 RepID=A0A6G1FZN6_9PEZI|nr:PLC-like phosphodiesterase [Eremomyces bilateralis CBS 781.70]KAF1811130.1 PLC-like phosphodiesterase [Eremomyces bilateralis CBS 781.70]
MKPSIPSLISLLFLPAYAQLESSGSTYVLSGTILNSIVPDEVPTGTEASYISYTGTRTISTTGTFGSGQSEPVPTLLNVTETSGSSATTQEVTLIGGNSTRNATQTTTSAQPINTQPCNNYLEFCTRRYSNITEVAAHNSPFSRQGNAASNQYLGVIDQLNDGVRMLQGQVHSVNDTMYLCHSSCDMLNVGTLEDYLKTVAGWVRQHPYDVLTIILGNANLVEVGNFTAPIQNSGITPNLYVPPEIPMSVERWPTLSEMILRQKRVVFFLDYKADQEEVPYILDEFSQIWETPFSPTDVNFPCTQERPPDLSREQALSRMYIANHNLNIEVGVMGVDLLIPNTASINQTNSVDGNGSLGLMANTCISDWGRPPNFLLVDHYNIGNGSVFEVAAQLNNVKYNRTCCGQGTSPGSRVAMKSWLHLILPVASILILTH